MKQNAQRIISKLSNKVRRRLDGLAKRYGNLTGAEGRVLNYLLAQDEPKFQRDIEEEFDLRAPTASELLNSMEKKGFIYRQSVEEDGRMRKITITPIGLDFKLQVQSDLLAMDNAIKAGISEQDLFTFFNVAQIMLKNLSD